MKKPQTLDEFKNKYSLKSVDLDDLVLELQNIHKKTIGWKTHLIIV